MGGQVEGNESRGLDGGERRPGWVEGGRGVVFPPRVAFVAADFQTSRPLARQSCPARSAEVNSFQIQPGPFFRLPGTSRDTFLF